MKKEAPKVEKYLTLISQLLQVNSTMSNQNNITTDIIDAYNDKRKNIQNNKNNTLETQETKFSISMIKEKIETNETHKNGFFVITDELKEEQEDDLSLKLRREILVSKLMYDDYVVRPKPLQSNFDDQILTSIYLGLSNLSRKILLDQISEKSDEYDSFHRLIGYDKEFSGKDFNVSNEGIMNLCQKFVNFKDCKNI